MFPVRKLEVGERDSQSHIPLGTIALVPEGNSPCRRIHPRAPLNRKPPVHPDVKFKVEYLNSGQLSKAIVLLNEAHLHHLFAC